jgi:hypothetical protein
MNIYIHYLPPGPLGPPIPDDDDNDGDIYICMYVCSQMHMCMHI